MNYVCFACDIRLPRLGSVPTRRTLHFQNYARSYPMAMKKGIRGWWLQRLNGYHSHRLEDALQNGAIGCPGILHRTGV